MLELQQIRYFVAVAENENVSHAAAALNVTQSPLSRQIMALEARLGADLFLRSRKRLKLTVFGHDFLQEAKGLLAHSAQVERRARAVAGGREGTLIVGYVEGAMHARLLGPALKAFRREAPRANVELRVMRSTEQHRQLEQRAIDIGLAYSRPTSAAALQATQVFSERFKLAVPAGSGWKASSGARQLDGQSFIAPAVSDNPAARQELVRHCQAAGFRPDIRYEAPNPLSALEMVAAGLGVSFVQASLARLKPNGVVLLDPPRAFRQTMSIFIVSRVDCAPLAQRFVAAFSEFE